MAIKGHKCIVSLLTPTKDQILNTKILRFNALLSKSIIDKPGIYICDNKKLRKGKSFNLHNDNSEQGNLHINKFVGIGKLAVNLKYLLCSALNIKKPNHQNSTENGKRDS